MSLPIFNGERRVLYGHPEGELLLGPGVLGAATAPVPGHGPHQVDR